MVQIKVSFLVSSQSILKRLSQNFATIGSSNFAKFHLVFRKLDHLTCNGNLRINQNEINGLIPGIEERNNKTFTSLHVKWSNFGTI